MSILNKLTEGIVRHDVRKETHALVRKWEKTGLLEGLDSARKKETMVRLLENQARLLLREQSKLGSGDVEGFAAVAFPLVRRVFAGLIANDLVSVQAMNNSVGLIFFLDFVYSDNIGASTTQTSRMGNVNNKSIYGTDQVASQITGGVNLLNSDVASDVNHLDDLSGPRTSVGYSYSSPTGSNTEVTSGDLAHSAIHRVFQLDGEILAAHAKLIDYDPDLMTSSGSLSLAIVDIAKSYFSQGDFNNMGAFAFGGLDGETDSGTDIFDYLNTATSLTATAAITDQIRRLTRVVENADTGLSVDAVRFYFTIEGNATEVTSAASVSSIISAASVKFPTKDVFAAGSGVGSIKATSMDLEANEKIPEIDIKIDSVEVRAQTKKLKAKWTQELGQDLSAWHNVDAEVELTSVLAEHVALEIDREILSDLIRGATGATRYWSRSPGLFVNRVTGAEIGASSAAPDFTGTVSEWYQTLIETINDVSAQIHRKTLRGGANFIVCSPEVANILEFTNAFRASVTVDAESGYLGVEKIGSLNRKQDVIVDPYFPRHLVLVGRRGKAFLESGYVYAPYVPLQTFPTIPHPEDFTPRMGVMTRYGKKMIRPDMYGLVIVRGLLGEAGATS